MTQNEIVEAACQQEEQLKIGVKLNARSKSKISIKRKTVGDEVEREKNRKKLKN